MKILALDLGDRWIGAALSDALKITCKPLETVELANITTFLSTILQKEPITTIVIGNPKTMKGNESDQTKKIHDQKKQLEEQFTQSAAGPLTWILWDERLSSKRASTVQNNKTDAESKKKSHSLAAAFILQSYLDFLAFNAPQQDNLDY